MNSEEIKQEIQRRIDEGRKKLLDEVATQLQKEKEAVLIEARQKAVSILYELNLGCALPDFTYKHTLNFVMIFVRIFGGREMHISTLYRL